MSFYLGKDRRDPSKALLHITSDTRQNINSINAGFDSNSVFHSDLPYLSVLRRYEFPVEDKGRVLGQFRELLGIRYQTSNMSNNTSFDSDIRAGYQTLVVAESSSGQIVHLPTAFSDVGILTPSLLDFRSHGLFWSIYSTVDIGQGRTGLLGYGIIDESLANNTFLRPTWNINSPVNYVNLIIRRNIGTLTTPLNAFVPNKVVVYILNITDRIHPLADTEHSGIYLDRDRFNVGDFNLENYNYLSEYPITATGTLDLPSRDEDFILATNPTIPLGSLTVAPTLVSSGRRISNPGYEGPIASAISRPSSIRYRGLYNLSPPSTGGWEISPNSITKNGLDQWFVGDINQYNPGSTSVATVSYTTGNGTFPIRRTVIQDTGLAVPSDANTVLIVFNMGSSGRAQIPILATNVKGRGILLANQFTPGISFGASVSTFIEFQDTVRFRFQSFGNASPRFAIKCGIEIHYLR